MMLSLLSDILPSVAKRSYERPVIFLVAKDRAAQQKVFAAVRSTFEQNHSTVSIDIIDHSPAARHRPKSAGRGLVQLVNLMPSDRSSDYERHLRDEINRAVMASNDRGRYLILIGNVKDRTDIAVIPEDLQHEPRVYEVANDDELSKDVEHPELDIPLAHDPELRGIADQRAERAARKIVEHLPKSEQSDDLFGRIKEELSREFLEFAIEAAGLRLKRHGSIQKFLPDAERSVYPDGVPLYDQTYKDRLGTYRTAYQKMHGTLPKAWSDEDYSAVRYFKEVWGPIRAASSVPITTHYLRQKDQALFHALDHYIRQSQKGVRDRQMLTFEDLGILTERAAAKRVLAGRLKDKTH
jgi:hypothetical protein